MGYRDCALEVLITADKRPGFVLTLRYSKRNCGNSSHTCHEAWGFARLALAHQRVKLAGGRVSPPIKLLSSHMDRSHNTVILWGCGSVFPTIKTYRACCMFYALPLSPNLYIYYTVIN